MDSICFMFSLYIKVHLQFSYIVIFFKLLYYLQLQCPKVNGLIHNTIHVG